MNRCSLCGAFLEAGECPAEEQEDHPTVQPGSEYLPGRVVSYGGGVCVIVSGEDKNGMVGLSILHERVRAPVQDVEEIT